MRLNGGTAQPMVNTISALRNLTSKTRKRLTNDYIDANVTERSAVMSTGNFEINPRLVMGLECAGAE